MRGVPLRESEKGRNVMKSIKRRLLSLFMAMVMVCSLAPSALATENEPGTNPDDTNNPDAPIVIEHVHVWDEGQVTKQPTCQENGERTFTCTAPDCPDKTKTEFIDKLPHTEDAGTTNPAPTCTEDGLRTFTCTVCKEVVRTEKVEKLGHTYNENGVCIRCGAIQPTEVTLSISPARLDYTFSGTAITGSLSATVVPETTALTWSSSNPSIVAVSPSADGKSCTITVLGAGTATISVSGGGKTAACTVNVTDTSRTILLDRQSYTLSNTESSVTLVPTIMQNGTVVSNPTDKITWTSSNSNVATVDQNGVVTAVRSGTAVITATLTNGAKASCTITVSNPLRMTISNSKLTTSNSTAVLYVYYNDRLINGADIDWSRDRNYVQVTNASSTSNYSATVTPVATTGSRGTTITANYTVGGVTYSASVTVEISTSAGTAAVVTVYNSTDRYNLNDRDDEDNDSIIEQLEDYFSRTSSWYYGLESVSFGSTVTNTYGNLSATANRTYYVNGTSSQLDLADVYFVPAARTGTATFNVTANVYTSPNSRSTTGVACTISFKVEEGASSGGDVIYTASVGDNVYFNVSDFEDFWDDNFSRGTLESVSFKVSGGTLRDSDGKTVGTKDCYVSPRSSQVDLDGVYFEPNSTTARRSGTVKFTFTATGYSRNSSRATTKSGTVSIIYLNNSPKDITYSVASGGTVNLRASDFTAAYKEATGNTAPSGMTIVFQNVPRNGTLTYTDSSKRNASAVTLTSSNIKSRSFTTRSSGTNQIEDVSYRGTSATDTIDYIAYSGSTPQFTGKVVFNGAAVAPTDISVTFTSTSGTAAVFSSAAFTTANASVLAKTTRIRFTTPSNGSLLLNGATNAVGIDIYPSNLGSVSYRPKAGFNGTDKCLFMAYDSTNTLVGSGTVNFVVAGNPSTTTPTTPTTPGASSISQFKDVSATAWYRTELADLVSKGIIKGKSTTSFAPRDKVTYGEALKMVLRAAGYTAEEPAGSNWAINYKTLAVNNGWISNDIVLNNPIPRSAMADLVAKVLGIASSSAASPFADSANGYAVALYNTSPKIFTGETGADGKLYFNGGDSLLREQICAVIYRVNQYYTNANSNTMPDGI